MRKLFVPIFVIVLLIVLPAISWYYLKSGMSWRREAIGELSDYGSVESVQIHLTDARDIDLQEFKDHLMIFYRMDCNAIDSEIQTLESIREQFEKRTDVQIFLSGDCLNQYTPKKARNNIIQKIDCQANEEACAELDQSFFKVPGKNIAFVDGNLNIRNYYQSANQDDRKRLIEHMAMMLPDERRKYGKENRN
jgi:hypothetical protein